MSTTPTEILETMATMVTEATVPDPTAVTEAALDFGSIKEMMDAFNPAALLPDLSGLFGSISTICRVAVMVGPVVLLVLGLTYLFLAPKEANHYFGYRCYFGMGSVQAWRFTQRLAGILLGGSGLILTVAMYAVSAGFAQMEMTDMVWKAAGCLVVQAVVALLANLAIHLTAMIRFDFRGEYRKAKKKKNKEK